MDPLRPDIWGRDRCTDGLEGQEHEQEHENKHQLSRRVNKTTVSTCDGGDLSCNSTRLIRLLATDEILIDRVVSSPRQKLGSGYRPPRLRGNPLIVMVRMHSSSQYKS